MKYELTQDSIVVDGHTLYRIKALQDIPSINVKKGDLGGFIKKESNLSHEDNAWISGNARVSDDAQIYGDARVYDDAQIFGNARVYDDAQIFGNAWVYENGQVFNNAAVMGRALIHKKAQVTGFVGLIDLEFNLTGNFAEALAALYKDKACWPLLMGIHPVWAEIAEQIFKNDKSV